MPKFKGSGIMECWNYEIMVKGEEFVSENTHHSNIPFFHYSVFFEL
jgi:hypothetical protein